MNLKVIFVVIISLLLSPVGSGQKTNNKITITGEVKDSLQIAVKGAVVYIDNKKTSSMTNRQGYYKIKVKPEARIILIFSPLKGASESIIDGKTTINFTLYKSTILHPSKLSNGDIVEPADIGHGTMTKKKQISGKASVNSHVFKSYSNMYELIQSELPGVQVRGTSVYVQGNSSFGGSSEAIFVVDGIVVDQINDVSPSDVKTIEVLKGPSTAAYGMRGANGVILIKTLRGIEK